MDPLKRKVQSALNNFHTNIANNVVNSIGQSRPNIPQQPLNIRPVVNQVKPIINKVANTPISVANFMPQTQAFRALPQPKITPKQIFQKAGDLSVPLTGGEGFKMLSRGNLQGYKDYITRPVDNSKIIENSTQMAMGSVGPGVKSNFSKQQLQLVKNGFTREVRDKIGQWAVAVERGGLKKTDPLNDYVYSLGESVFGKKAAFLSPKQLLNALDVAQEQAFKLRGTPSMSVGLTAGDLRAGKLKPSVSNAGLSDASAQINAGRKVIEGAKGRLTSPKSNPQQQLSQEVSQMTQKAPRATSVSRQSRIYQENAVSSPNSIADSFNTSKQGIARARLSSKALSEGITEPRMGSHIAVPTQAGIKYRVRNQMKELDATNQNNITNTNPIGKMQQALNKHNSGRVQTSSYNLNKQGLPQTSRQVASSFEDIIDSADINVKNKVNFLDYFRTPDRVLRKMGLGRESDLIRQKYDDYLTELPKEIDKVTAWSQRVSGESNQRIFKYLDGQPIKLEGEELVVANEIKDYLKQWADRLKLPPENRITNYITHIFEKDFIKKEFDPEVAALIRDRVPGSVYDPFTEQRLGKAGYLEDTWRALDAYVKRATRKVNMDEALDMVSSKSKALEDSQFNYVKRYVDKINMRPGQIDQLIDNFIKSTPVGYKLGQRPLTATTRKLRQWVYRGTLGLNVGSALRNLTQGANTYSKLGEKYTAAGYYKLAKAIASGDDELERVGVLRDNFIQDRTISATGKAWEKFDKGLWVFFNFAEKINRGSAYYGAKAKAIANGATEEQAIKAGRDLVRDTQFTFGSVDTPQAFQSDLMKTLGQFQSFNLKQAEFLGEMIKNKEFAGLTRFGIASTAMMLTIGELIGIKPTDFIPFSGVFKGDTKLGQTPPVKLARDVVDTVVGAKDEYGNQPDAKDRIDTFINDSVPFVPGGVQIKKSVDALRDYQRGYDESRSGRVKYPIQQTPDRFARGVLFGSNKLPEAQDYYDNKRTVLSEKQTESFRSATNPKKYYNEVIQKRQANKEAKEAGLSTNEATNVRNRVKSSGQSETYNGVVYYRDNGSVKSLKTQRPMVSPKLTGQTDLDKKLVSSFKSKISSRQTEVAKLYQQGHISAEQAEKEIDRLEALKTDIAKKTKKPKKLSVKKVGSKRAPSLKIKKQPKLKFKKVAKKGRKLAQLKVKQYKAIKKPKLA